MRDHRQVEANGLAEIIRLIDMRRNHGAGGQLGEQATQRRRRDQARDDLAHVRQQFKRFAIGDRQIAFRRRMPAQEYGVRCIVDADAAAARAPQRFRHRLHFSTQPRRVAAQRQARTAPNQGGLVEQRMGGKRKHGGGKTAVAKPVV